LEKLKLQSTHHVTWIIQFLSLQHCKDQLISVKINHVTVKMWLKL